MKTYIEHRKSLEPIAASIRLSQALMYDWHYRRERCFQELKRLKSAARGASQAFRDTEFMPCGYQDAAGDKAEFAWRDFETYFNALRICSGVMPKTLISAWNRATGVES